MKTYSSAREKFTDAMLALGIFVGGIGSANALVIDLADGPYNFALSKTGGPYNLSATGSIDITALSATSATVNLTLNNTSSGALVPAGRLHEVSERSEPTSKILLVNSQTKAFTLDIWTKR